MSGPTVSICIPTYRGAPFLSEAVESVLRQNFRDLELLIIDDSSRDGTEEICRRYVREDSRVVYRLNETNVGMVENWNRCLRSARGRYIKYLFQDDVLLSPDALGKMVRILDEEPDVSLVASARQVIDSGSRVLRTDSCFKAPVRADGLDVIRFCLMKHGNMIGEPSVVLFRKSQAERGFNSAYKQIVDLEMWFHLLEQGKFAYVEEPLCAFRVHGEQQTRKNIETLIHIEDFQLLFEEYLSRDFLGFGPMTRHHIRFYQIYNLWKLSRMNVYNRELAEEKKSRYYGKLEFRLWLPFYKLCDPFFKYRRSLLRKRLLR